MASLPLHNRPRTPSSPRKFYSIYATPEQNRSPAGLGLQQYESPAIRTHHDYDIQHGINDSLTKPPTSGRLDSASTMLSPAFSAGGRSPNGTLYTPLTPQTASTDMANFEPLAVQQGPNNPFNFTTQQYVAGKGRADAVGKRKGHKYRHSSMHASAMDSIIQSPAMRTPLAVPASLPVPNRKEVWRSLSSTQTARLTWCLCHFIIAGYVQFLGMGSLSMTTLSRLLFFDAAGAVISVVVNVMSNFEVWKRSSIRHPFGLQRADVLAGFGMAVFISFMGLDSISHGIQHSLENLGTHESHHSHDHERLSKASVGTASLLAVISTIISAVLLRNHEMIAKATNFSLLSGFGCVLGNPSHILTLSTSLLLLLLPSLSDEQYKVYDLGLCIVVALVMVAFGARLGIKLASMLLMSYKPSSDQSSVREVISEIETESTVSFVEEAKVWQVHYGLCMANLKLRYRGSVDEMSRLQERVSSLIRRRMGNEGSGGPKWEISVQMAMERD